MTFENLTQTTRLPKKHLPSLKENMANQIFNSKYGINIQVEDYDSIKEERDKFFNWLKEFEERTSEEIYFEAAM